jgi:photosystem II stability/assembly factor-like uncharacterized protein
MKSVLFLLLPVLFISCNTKVKKQEEYKPSFTSIEGDTLLESKISIRALIIDVDKAWYAGSNGKYGWVSLSGGKNFSGVIVKDSLVPEFRAIAQTSSAIFILNAGNPALLYKISKDGKIARLVYTENGEKVFYDSMQFYNDKQGMAMGDPTDSCISVITTNDGGETWKKIPCEGLPATSEGEAAFAASNTNLVIKEGYTWIVTGGKKSRVLFSPDKGKTWEVHNTPIVQGSEMTGIFSADFYDRNNGFAVGGDYEKQAQNTGNKIITEDGGKTWQLEGQAVGFGYASCVQYVPGSNANELFTAGPSGIYYSYDKGKNWKKVYEDTTLHTLRFADAKTIIAAGQGKIIRLKLK